MKGKRSAVSRQLSESLERPTAAITSVGDLSLSASQRRIMHTGWVARALLVWLFFLLLLPMSPVIVPTRVLAAPGDPVASFGTDGVVMTDFAEGNDSAQAVVPSLFDRFIAAGSATTPGQGTDFALAFYDETGMLDSTFGTNGKVITDFFGGNDGARGVVVQPDQKIVLSGFATNGSERQFAFARFNPDGTLDPTFDQDGKVVLDLGSTSEAFKVALQEDLKIVAVGDSSQQNNLDFTIVRLNPDGSLDPTFGINGVVKVDFGNADRAIDVVIDPNNPNTIYVSGIVVKTATDSDFGIVSLNSEGSLNNTFGGDGTVTTDFFGKQDGAQGIRIFDITDPANPKLVVTGFATDETSDFAFGRYDFNGNLDTSFDGDGKQTVDFSGSRDLSFGLINQPDGGIVATGWAGDGANFNLGMIKLKPDGALNSGFGSQGIYTLDTASGGNNVAFDAMLYKDTIIAAGTGLNPLTGNDDFVITQHENEEFVEFTKTANPDPAVEGNLITYTFTITNRTDKAIEAYIVDGFTPAGTINTLPAVDFEAARNPLWTPIASVENKVTRVKSKPFTVRSMETYEVTLVVRAARFGSNINEAHLFDSLGPHLAEASVNHFILRRQITNVTQNGKRLTVTGDFGTPESNTSQARAIEASAIESQAQCPTILVDGQEKKTKPDPENPTTVLIAKKGGKKIASGQTVRIRVRLCNGLETDDFLYTRPR